MFERFKLGVMRRLAAPMVAFNWRRGRATDLVVGAESIAVDGGRIGVRIFTPRGSGPWPMMLYFHGGGWVGCDLDTHDPLCRDLCVQTERVVVSVDYRLAPEYPFPIGVNDCLASLNWILQNARRLNGDGDRLIVCGDSAGGNLAAVVANQARETHPGMIKAQVLIYPVTDHAGSDWPSYTTHGGKGHKLTRDGMLWLWDLYLRNSPLLAPGETRHDLATPLHVQDLSGLPPSFFVLAEFDALCDEGAAYAKRLADAGVDVELKTFAQQQHGIVGLAPRPAHREAVADIASWLSRKLT